MLHQQAHQSQLFTNDDVLDAMKRKFIPIQNDTHIGSDASKQAPGSFGFSSNRIVYTGERKTSEFSPSSKAQEFGSLWGSIGSSQETNSWGSAQISSFASNDFGHSWSSAPQPIVTSSEFEGKESGTTNADEWSKQVTFGTIFDSANEEWNPFIFGSSSWETRDCREKKIAKNLD